MNRISKLFRRVIPVLVLGAAACTQSVPSSPNTLADEGPTLTVAQQHAANLRAIEAERAASKARYPGLVAAWKARNSGGIQAASSPGTFVPCAPLPFEGQAQVVGPDGGSFSFGPHTLDVPAGALTAPVSIAVILPSATKNEVILLPHGTQFVVPVQLTLAYDNCAAASTHRIAYIDSNSNVLGWPTSTDGSGQVVATLNHFSQYAIAY